MVYQLACKLQTSSNLKKASDNALIIRRGALPRIKVKGASLSMKGAKVRASANANALQREKTDMRLILLDERCACPNRTSECTINW